MQRAPLYAQFDGDEIDGTRYALGDEIAENAHPGILAVLSASGRVSANKPSLETAPAVMIDKPVDDMSRLELVSSATAAFVTRIGDASDNDLRGMIERHREEQGGHRGADGASGGEKPLARMTTAELTALAEGETIDLSAASTNAERVTAIEEARKAKAAA